MVLLLLVEPLASLVGCLLDVAFLLLPPVIIVLIAIESLAAMRHMLHQAWVALFVGVPFMFRRLARRSLGFARLVRSLQKKMSWKARRRTLADIEL